MRGYCQSEWQYGYASEEVSNEQVSYVEMCYFNTGIEYIVYESKEDYENGENGCSYYVDSFKSKENLAKELGCEEKDIELYEFKGYSKTPIFELAK